MITILGDAYNISILITWNLAIDKPIQGTSSVFDRAILIRPISHQPDAFDANELL